MKKTFLLFVLLSAFFAVAQPSLPITTVNNLKISNPILGTKNDSILVYRGTGDKVVRFLPVSSIVGTPVTPNDLNETMALGSFTEHILQFQGGAGIDFWTGSFHGYFEDNAISATKTRKLPNDTNTLATRLNGHNADTNGNIITPIVQSVTGSGVDNTDPANPVITVTVDIVPTDGSANPVQSNGVYDALQLKANIASPTFTGTPLAPTATTGTNTTQVATTAFVLANSINIPHLEFNSTDKTVWNNGKSDVASNTSFGDLALRVNTGGIQNTAVGVSSLAGNTVGSNNTALGYQSLQSATTASNNTAVGYTALKTITTATNNTAVGFQCLNNSTASNNTGIGYNALNSNTSGTNNVSLGNSALSNNITGSQNVFIGNNTTASSTSSNNVIAIGYNVTGGVSNTVTIGNTSITSTQLRGNVLGGAFIKSGGLSSEFLMADGGVSTAGGTGSLEFNSTDKTVWNNGKSDVASNTSFGDLALRVNTTGANNTIIGYQSLTANTTGSNNTAIGHNSLSSNTTGNSNISVGLNSLANSNSDNNTAVGVSALLNNTTGTNNVAIGNTALYNNTTGSQNTYIGRNAIAAAVNNDNVIVIGYNVTGGASNTVTIGNTSITSTRLRGSVLGASFIKDAGTSSQVLMADGSVSNLAQYITNSTTVVLSSATLNSTYPSANTGDKVYCTSITLGAMVYEKAPSGWVGYAVVVP